MNCKNLNPEISPLKARLHRMGIHVPGNFPTPLEIIPILERRLAQHMKHISRTAGSASGDFAEWKQIHDEYQEFLAELRACTQTPPEKPTAAPIVPAQQIKMERSEPGKNSELPAPQQNHARNEPGIKPEQPGMNPELPGMNQNETGKFPNETGNSDQSKPSPTSEHATAPSTTTAPPASEQDPDAPPKIQSTDEEFVAAATELHYQRKGRSPFDKLSAQDQAIIMDLFEKFRWEAVLKVIAQPPPIGFSLKVSKTALYDFQKRYDKRRRQQNIQASIDLLNKASDPTQAFAQTFERLVQTKALVVASDPQTSLNIFDAVITTVNKLRKQSLAERKQLHAENAKIQCFQKSPIPEK